MGANAITRALSWRKYSDHRIGGFNIEMHAEGVNPIYYLRAFGSTPRLCRPATSSDPPC